MKEQPEPTTGRRIIAVTTIPTDGTQEVITAAEFPKGDCMIPRNSCNHDRVTVVENSGGQCNVCGSPMTFNRALSRWMPTPRAAMTPQVAAMAGLENAPAPEKPNIPPEVDKAVKKIAEWQSKNQIKTFVLGPICSSDHAAKLQTIKVYLLNP